MAANDYFKVAASNIRRAVELKRAEINDIRAQLEVKKAEVSKEIQRLKSEIQAKQGDIARSQQNQDEPEKDRASKLKEVNTMNTRIVDMQHTLVQEQDQAASYIKGIESELIGLDQQASSLETRT